MDISVEAAICMIKKYMAVLNRAPQLPEIPLQLWMLKNRGCVQGFQTNTGEEKQEEKALVSLLCLAASVPHYL